MILCAFQAANVQSLVPRKIIKNQRWGNTGKIGEVRVTLTIYAVDPSSQVVSFNVPEYTKHWVYISMPARDLDQHQQ